MFITITLFIGKTSESKTIVSGHQDTPIPNVGDFVWEKGVQYRVRERAFEYTVKEPEILGILSKYCEVMLFVEKGIDLSLGEK